ncbi:hypothetical protein UA08_06298 [Talaromyces atroroseus]|uniref:AAA+ ATPase domain-containing protein n=1 Tax=Talaromyces atroroseus TaxID=1441469 RepID=A0A225AKB6_TALAT|nr:hypothetical protein UA08_06298 [Talaromyces atroroseus]OKL58744.1 hypothetical protein UA08_06298 [Talaromyces atroroseus]
MAAQCSLWKDGHVSDCMGEILPPATCLISAFILCSRHLYASCRIRSVNVPSGQRYITVLSPLVRKLELFGLLADIVVVVFSILGAHQDRILFSSLLITTIPSIYLLLLIFLRRSSHRLALQSHSVVLYSLQWIFLATAIHKQIVTGEERPILLASLIRFAISATLCLFHWTAKRIPAQTSDGNDDILASKLSKDGTASALSRLSFFWLNELIWKAYRTTLEVSDLYPLNPDQKSDVVARHFDFNADYLSVTSTPLLRRLWRFIKYDIVVQGGWAAINSVAVYISPALIRVFLKNLESPEEGSNPATTGWLCVGGFLIAGVLVGTADCQCEWKGRQTSAKVRAVLVNEIYTKVLRRRIAQSLPSDTGKEHQVATDGGIFNLMSIDAENVSAVSGDLHFVWVTFLVQTSIGTWFLYRILGISGILGVLVMVALLPLNFLISQRVMAVQARVLTASDARIHVTNDILNNLRTIKYSAWVKPFMERVLKRRRAEMIELRSRCIWWSINMTTFHALPFLVTMITLFLYTIIWGQSLGTSTAFPALAIFGIIRIPLDRMASSVTFIMRAHVSLTRIESFLQEKETGKYDQLRNTHVSVPETIGFENATLAWPTGGSGRERSDSNDTSREDIALTDIIPSSPYFRLENLQITFRPNALNVVCGPSGSGKSSLLLSLLGEMDLIHGHVILPHEKKPGELSFTSLNDTTAYCSQEPWILNRSIRSNILMDLPFDGRRYENVLQATGLVQDIAALDHGDLSLAGEGGSRLSGGQKQRVALARTLYSTCKYVLLDDCLSAVDSRTASHIFFQAIKGPLMYGRTCILATHAVQLVTPHCDYLVILDDGRVAGQGTAKELASTGVFKSVIVGDRIHSPPTDADSSGENAKSNAHEGSVLPQEIDGKPDDLESQSKYTESKAEGTVTWPVIRTYLVTMGPRSYWIIVFFMFGAQQIAALGTNLWIKQWSFEYDKIGDSQTQKPNAWYYMTIYIAICLAYVLITFIRDLITLYGSLKASSGIYEKLLQSVLRAKPLFFDKTPFGQITNRLTKDVEVMDQSLPGFSISALQLIASMVMVIGMISSVVPAFLVAAAFICVAYCLVTAVYINGARDLKRIESVQRSPLYQQFAESLAGCVSLRAYAQTGSFTLQNHALVDQINQSYLLQWATQAWLTFRIDVLSSLVSFFTGAFVLLNSSSIDPGSAGLVLTFAATFTENVMWFVQVYSIVQRNLNSVERIIEYIDVEQEESGASPKLMYDFPRNWPTDGRVRFDGYSTRYAPELDMVLNNVTFEVCPGERVAVVGRTGAGKSSLALALIRALESESGHIEIDGVDIRSLPLDQLRQAITLVPQDPQLFDGTIRDNLDPLHAHNDEEMLSLLRHVRLVDNTHDASEKATETENKGFSRLDQTASTLSRGQRQLLCIVRGLLRKTRILVLDEATASIDHETDAAIQATIRISIAHGTTVLTIAHRLRTIADYDRVVVLDTGRVIEEGSVRNLLARRGNGAVFRRLCEESGDIENIEQAAGVVRAGKF